MNLVEGRECSYQKKLDPYERKAAINGKFYRKAAVHFNGKFYIWVKTGKDNINGFFYKLVNVNRHNVSKVFVGSDEDRINTRRKIQDGIVFIKGTILIARKVLNEFPAELKTLQRDDIEVLKNVQWELEELKKRPWELEELETDLEKVRKRFDHDGKLQTEADKEKLKNLNDTTQKIKLRGFEDIGGAIKDIEGAINTAELALKTGRELLDLASEQTYSAMGYYRDSNKGCCYTYNSTESCYEAATETGEPLLYDIGGGAIGLWKLNEARKVKDNVELMRDEL